jgi:hypothetical protein
LAASPDGGAVPPCVSYKAHETKTRKDKPNMKMTQDCEHFLEALLFALPEDEPENIREATIYDFSPEFISGLEAFIGGFREIANERNPAALEAADDCTRSFGGSVYYSLSGHGVGFWDDEETAAMQSLLEEYRGNSYRFEELGSNLSFREDGKLDLAFIPEALDAYRTKLFSR